MAQAIVYLGIILPMGLGMLEKLVFRDTIQPFTYSIID